MIILKLLETIPFFWEFTQEELQRLTESDSYFVNYKPGDYLLKEGEDKDHAMLILIRGRVRVSRANKPDQTIATLEPGAVIGEISFLTKRPRTTNVVAVEESTAFRLDNASLKTMEPNVQLRIKDRLIEVLVQRLDQMNEVLSKVVR